MLLTRLLPRSRSAPLLMKVSCVMCAALRSTAFISPRGGLLGFSAISFGLVRTTCSSRREDILRIVECPLYFDQAQKHLIIAVGVD